MRRYNPRLLLRGYHVSFAAWADGKPVPFPIEDDAYVDARRAQIGLGPLSDYLAVSANRRLPFTIQVYPPTVLLDALD